MLSFWDLKSHMSPLLSIDKPAHYSDGLPISNNRYGKQFEVCVPDLAKLSK